MLKSGQLFGKFHSGLTMERIDHCSMARQQDLPDAQIHYMVLPYARYIKLG